MLEQVSASKIGTTEPFVLNPSPAASREAQLAAGLGKLISEVYPNRFAGTTSRQADRTSAPHPSLDLLLELLPENIAEASYPTIAKIVDSLQHLQRTRQAQTNRLSQDYIDLMKWGALLRSIPISILRTSANGSRKPTNSPTSATHFDIG